MTEERSLITFDPFVMMDHFDDEAILAELEGQALQALVYEFPQDGQTIRGLSKGGVDAVAAEMAKQGEVLRELELTWEDNGDYVLFRAKVGRFRVAIDKSTGEMREVLLDTVFGLKRQDKQQARRDGSLRDNPFWFETGGMKAVRNAKARLIREDLKEQILLQAVKDGRTRRAAPPPAPRGTPPPAAAKTNGDPSTEKDREAYGRGIKRAEMVNAQAALRGEKEPIDLSAFDAPGDISRTDLLNLSKRLLDAIEKAEAAEPQAVA